MGHVFAEIDLSNPRQIDLESLKVKALADTGSWSACCQTSGSDVAVGNSQGYIQTTYVFAYLSFLTSCNRYRLAVQSAYWGNKPGTSTGTTYSDVASNLSCRQTSSHLKVCRLHCRWPG